MHALDRLPRHPLRRRTIPLVAGAMLVASLTMTAPAAFAETPANDAWDAATAVGELPFEDTVDTTEATTDAVNPPELVRYKAHTVWYHFQAAADGEILASTRGTDYHHKLLVFSAEDASQPADQWIRLQGDRGTKVGAGLVQPVEEDQHYFLVIGTQESDEGGTAQLLVRPPAVVRFSLAGRARLDRVDGSAVLHGGMQSDLPTTVTLQIGIRQRIGERVVWGNSWKRLTPGPEADTWHLRIISTNRPFRLGKARLHRSVARFYDRGVLIGTVHFAHHTVTLR